MVKLSVKSVKEIVVLDDVKYDTAESFFKDLALGMPPGEVTVNWADGVIFTHSAFPWSEATIKEYIEHDKIYWSHVRYAPMKEYKDRVVEGNVVFRIRKTEIPILLEIAKELKRRLGLEGSSL